MLTAQNSLQRTYFSPRQSIGVTTLTLRVVSPQRAEEPLRGGGRKSPRNREKLQNSPSNPRCMTGEKSQICFFCIFFPIFRLIADRGRIAEGNFVISPHFWEIFCPGRSRQKKRQLTALISTIRHTIITRTFFCE